MNKRIFVVLAIMASLVTTDMLLPHADLTGNVCMAYDRNSDGYIYKGTIYLTRVASGHKDQFYLFNKRGVDYVATSKNGPYYRLANRMKINNIDYKR